MKNSIILIGCLLFFTSSWSQTYKLDVDGNINFTGSLYQNGVLFSGSLNSGSLSSSPNTLVKRNNNGWVFQNKIYLTQNTNTSYVGTGNCMKTPSNNGTGVPGSSSMYSTIYRNCDGGREELLLNGGTASYGSGHNGASIHIHGNSDDEHPGALALLTGGLGRLLINKYGEVAVGGTSIPYDSLPANTAPTNNLYNYMDDGHDNPSTWNPGRIGAMDGVFNIWEPEGKPALYIQGANSTEGDIAWKASEALTMGIWDYSSKTFTSYLNIQSDGDLQLLQGVAYKPGGGSWTTLSDARLKTDIQPFGDGLSEILRIKPIRFRYNEKSGFNNLDKYYVGILAQDMLSIAPYMVEEEYINPIEESDIINGNALNSTKYYTFDDSAINYMLINAIQEQQEIIKKLEDRITQLETK